MKSPDTAKVRLEQESIILELSENSPLLSGVHRIYFANVLGFEPSNDPVGYILSSHVPDPNLIVKVIDYLREQNIQVKANRLASNIVQKFLSAADELDSAMTAGKLIKTAPPKSIETPKLKRTLKPYQIPAVAHAIAVKNAANFSVPGSGKTTVVLATFAILRDQKEVEKIIVVAPRSAFQPWEEEFQACFQRKPRAIRVSGSRQQRMKLYRKVDAAELVLMTYQMATNDRNKLSRVLQQYRSLLVLDESHNIKRLEGGTWAPALIDVGNFASRRMILTGTPAPNSGTDLWSQMTFLWPNPPVLGAREQFKFQMGQHNEHSFKNLRKQLFPLYWRTRKSDLGLPKPSFRRIRLKLRPYQSAIYKVLAAKVLSEVVKAPMERQKLRVWRTARMVRLLQAASNPGLLTEYSTEFEVPPLSAAGLSVDELIQDYHKYETPVKIEFATKLVRELVENRQKVLVWTAFVHNIRTLEQSLRDLNPRVVYGDIPKDSEEDLEFNRERMIHDFKTSPKHCVLIANPSACAESISLHKVCSHAIYLDRTFNAAHYMQSLDRIHRVGMDPNEKVRYYVLQCMDSIDEVIDRRLAEKEVRMRRLLDEDISVMNLEFGAADFTEESEEDRDFSALIAHLKATG